MNRHMPYIVTADQVVYVTMGACACSLLEFKGHHHGNMHPFIPVLSPSFLYHPYIPSFKSKDFSFTCYICAGTFMSMNMYITISDCLQTVLVIMLHNFLQYLPPPLPLPFPLTKYTLSLSRCQSYSSQYLPHHIICGPLL